MMNSVNINHDIRIVKAIVNSKEVWRVYLKQKLHSEHPTKQAAFKKAYSLKLIYN
jgi:hypothetical protein